jgi:Flp pilus assembly protein TadG
MKIASLRRKRLAATAVEFAVVAPVLLFVLLGIFEFCRFLMVKQLAENATREGARHAVARTDTLQTGTTVASIQAQVTNYLLQAGFNLKNKVIRVYKSNQAGEPLDLNGNVVANVAQAASWEQTRFGEYICVTLDGDFEPIVPSFLNLAPTMKVNTAVVMCSEGN